MKIASTAKRIFDRQCKKTFATKSAITGLVQCSKKTAIRSLRGVTSQRELAAA
jgi:hypothetical protein